MRISGLKVFVANVARTNLVFVTVTTDEGITGVGEATLEWKTLTIRAALEDMERAVIGRDPFATDALVEALYRDSYWRTGAVFRTAIGAIEAACLDIKGKALGVPVYELLGGRQRDRVACYANHWFHGAVTPEDHARQAKAAVALGYRALKWDPYGSTSLEPDRAQRRQTIEIVAAVRDAVGPDVELMLDVHGRLNVPAAIATCRDLAPYDLAWIEEPVPPEALDALVEVRRASPVPIAAGERWYEPGMVIEALRRGAVDVLQTDTSHFGGLGETKRIAHLAHAQMIPMAPHNPTGPVMNAMTLHLSLAIPNFRTFETVSMDVPWRAELVRESLRFEAGDLLAPEAPGLGVELIEAACARFPYQATDLPLFDGTMNRNGVAGGRPVLGA